jgi:hypothetical protein
MAFCKVISKSPTNPNKVKISMIPCIDEYKYYKDFVETQTNRVYKSTNLRFLDLNTALYRMLEILLEKFHDIDAKNSIAGDIIFYAVALAQSTEIDANMEEGKGQENRKMDASIFASEFCLAAKATSSAFIKLHKDPDDRRIKDELAYEIGELIDTTYGMAHVNSLHDLLAINIQKRGDRDRILMERFLHIQQAPFMQLEMESNTIYPLLYHVPKIPNQNFLITLLISAGVNVAEKYVYIEEVVNKLFDYGRKLMEKEKMSRESVSRIFRSAFGQNYTRFNIDDKNSLIWPLSRVLIMENYATMWNMKFPHKHFLMNINMNNVLPAAYSLSQPNMDILRVKIPQPWICDPQLNTNSRWGSVLQTTPMDLSRPRWAVVHRWTNKTTTVPTTTTSTTPTSTPSLTSLAELSTTTGTVTTCNNTSMRSSVE